MRDFNKIFIQPNFTIREAIEKLDQTGKRILIVVENKRLLAGCITDGDIRRAILKGKRLEEKIAAVVNLSPFFVTTDQNLSNENVHEILIEKNIVGFPMIDSKNRVIEFFHQDDFNIRSKRENYFCIMAGGKGTRLRPMTEKCPKPMIELSGKPILLHIIEKARSEGFEKFILSVNYLSEVITDYFGDGSKFNVEIEYLFEDKPLGTAGSLSLIKKNISTNFLVTNGDVLTETRYTKILEYHEENNAYATMAVREQIIKNEFGVVDVLENKIVNIREKPITKNFINAGIYAFKSDIIDLIKQSHYLDMPDLFIKATNNNKKAIAFPLYENWVDIGTKSDLKRLHDS